MVYIISRSYSAVVRWMLCRICTAHICPRKHVLDDAGYTAPTRKHELNPLDQENVCRKDLLYIMKGGSMVCSTCEMFQRTTRLIFSPTKKHRAPERATIHRRRTHSTSATHSSSIGAQGPQQKGALFPILAKLIYEIVNDHPSRVLCSPFRKAYLSYCVPGDLLLQRRM